MKGPAMRRQPIRSLLVTLGFVLGSGAIGPASHASAAQDERASGATVTLLDAGHGEQRVLRWTPQVGVPVRARMKMAMEMSLAFDGNPMPPVNLPAYVFTVSATAGEPDDQGRYPVETVYESVELEGDVDPMVRDAIWRVLRPLEGTKLTFVTDSRGFVTETNAADLPAQILDLLGGANGVRRMVESLSQPLPEEAVGPGARWRVEQSLTMPNAPTLKNSVVYELVRREGDTIEVKITGEQTASEQKFDSGVPGAQTTLKQASGRIEGESFMRLDRLLPVRAVNEGSTKLTFEIVERGITQLMEQFVSVRFEVEHLDEGGAKPVDPDDAG